MLEYQSPLPPLINTVSKGIPGLKPIVGSFASLGLFYGVNNFLNRLVLCRHKAEWDWKTEVVLITGGSGGIGSQMVKKFAARNVTVISFDTKPPDTLPDNAHFYNVDITCPEAIHEAAEKIRDEIGTPTVLINNAGLVLGKDILHCSKDQIKRMFGVNILSHFWLVQEFLPAMITAQHGHIVTMASVASFITIASNIDYSCTKAGLVAFHEGLAQDLKHRYNTRDVMTSIIYPYWVRTPLIQNLTAHPSFKDPLLEPEHIAEVVVDHVIRGQSGQVYLPAHVGLLSAIRGFPLWLQEVIRDGKADVLRETTF